MNVQKGEMPHPLSPFLQPARNAIHDFMEKLPRPLAEFLLFGFKMAWSCLFAAAFLALLILTHFLWKENLYISRYDFLFLMAILIQAIMLWTRLESFEELKVIMAYHIVGTIMEIFKTHVGSWEYPEDSLIRIGGVPLFTGFMYGTVGSFMARAIRIFEMKFENYPANLATIIIAILIYINFFSHHYIWDLRNLIFVGIFIVYFKTQIHFRPMNRFFKMPLLLAAFLSSFFMWLAENIGTYTKTWVYPSNDEVWHMVSFAKMGSWFLLLFISFTIVMVVLRPNNKIQ